MMKKGLKNGKSLLINSRSTTGKEKLQKKLGKECKKVEEVLEDV